jgi:signal transduction histidine kinase
LHNLGNILNGVTVSSGIIQEKLRQSKIPMLQKAASLMRDHIDDLPAFIADDNRGKVLPSYITELSAQLELELSVLIKEVETLRSCTEHVTGFINVQQNFALAPSQLREMVAVNTLMDQAYKLTINTFEMKGIKVQCEFNCVESVLVDRHKVLQVLLNLLSNARHALQSRDGERRVILRTYLGDGVACMEVADNGVGIDSKDLPLIFNQGFTTKKDGHGFGLHSSANWVREMGGTLRATSDGVGHGVTFRFELPLAVAVEEVDDVSDYAAAPIQQT